MSANPNARILGIDPGTNILGYAILDISQKQPAVLAMGVIQIPTDYEQPMKLKKIFEGVSAIINSWHPTEVAIEAPFYAKNVQSMLKLGRAQGVAIAAAITRDIPVFEYSPKKIKQSVTGKGNASKEQVAALLAQQLKATLDTEYLDATDALATALCHFYQNKNLAPGKKRYSSWEGFVKDNPTKLSK